MSEPAGTVVEGVLFLGCGRSAHAHSAALAAVAPGLARYYASRNETRARDACRRHHGAGWYGSYAEALDGAPAEIVVITTPAATRFDLTFLALAADRHVIVDPPAFGSASEGELVRDAAHAAGRRVLVAASAPYQPLTESLRRIVTERTLGDVRLVQVNALRRVDGHSSRRDGRVEADRVIADRLHWITFVSNLGLRVDGIGARAGRGRPARTQVLTLEYEGGAIGVLSHSSEIRSPLRPLRLSAIHGTQGTAVFETGGLFLLETGRRRRLVLSARDDLRGRRAMFADFLSSLAAGGVPHYAFAHACRDQALLEAACGRARHEYA